MKKVFIITRYRDKRHPTDGERLPRELAQARSACMYAILDGCVPVCPRLFHSDDLECSLGLSAGTWTYGEIVRNLMQDCDEVRRYGASVDPQMQAELDMAKELGKPVRVFNSIGIPYEDWNSVKFANDPDYQAACEQAGRMI